jgi:hypothetical protein
MPTYVCRGGRMLDTTVARTVKKKLPRLGLERSNVRGLRP